MDKKKCSSINVIYKIYLLLCKLKNETKKFPGFPPFPEIKILETVSTLANKHSHLAFQASRKLRETNIPVNEVMCGSFPFLSE